MHITIEMAFFSERNGLAQPLNFFLRPRTRYGRLDEPFPVAKCRRNLGQFAALGHSLNRQRSRDFPSPGWAVLPNCLQETPRFEIET